MLLAGTKGRESHRGWQAGAEEEGNHSENATFPYWSVFKIFGDIRADGGLHKFQLASGTRSSMNS
jgi:hypothetical protein